MTAHRCALTTAELHRLDVAVTPLRRLKGIGAVGIYLVGSATERPDFRDVDVRMIFRDADFDAWFCDKSELWEAFCYAWSRVLSEDSGLRVDFQIQRMTEANENHVQGSRNPLTGGARRFAGLGDGTPFSVHDPAPNVSDGDGQAVGQ